MTLREFLNLGILRDNLVIIQSRTCKGKCDITCSCVTHPLVKIVRNYDYVSEEMIISRGGGYLLDKKILKLYPLNNHKNCIVLEG